MQNNMEENKKSNEKRKRIMPRRPRRGQNNLNAKEELQKAQNKNEQPKTNKAKKSKNQIIKRPNNLPKEKKKENLSPAIVTVNKPAVKEEQQIAIKEDFAFKKENLKIIPLGGIEEIGKNITVFEYGNDIVIVDCGVAFPEEDMLGIDLVIPDFSYLEKNRDKIRGLVITHGHEDHIGSIAYLLKQINVPIYATKLTIGLIQNKLQEHHLEKVAKLNIVKQGQTVVFGKIRVEFIRSCHSIPDSVALAIHTPAGTVVHTGDFKIDYTPIDDQKIDLGRLAELGNKGVLALLSDSTNAERKGYTMSESTVGEVFDKLFLNCKKRIVIATFASNMHRVNKL